MAQNAIEALDAKLAALLADWSLSTTFLALLLLAFVAYPIFYSPEPDTHPLLLARQSSAGPVRSRNESANYRSPEVPYGFPLKSGLNVKDAGAPRWAPGRDGDLRDVWREVQKGDSEGGDGIVPKGLIMTVLGKEEVLEHEVEDLSREIGVMGKFLQERVGKGSGRVAVFLPNSVELLNTIFACAFYGLSPILLPYDLSHPTVCEAINITGADALVCAAGTLPLEDVAKHCQNLKLLTWVVEKSSRHMDWSGSPNSSLQVSVWHDIISENATSTATSLPTNQPSDKLGNLLTVSQPVDSTQPPTITSFTHSNLISATAALLAALPVRQRLNPSDLVLPADSLTHTYHLCQILGTLYTHASLALTPAANPHLPFSLATRGISPTIILASPATLLDHHTSQTANLTSTLQSLLHTTHTQTLQAGRLPSDTWLFRLLAPSTTASANKPGTLRLILTPHRLAVPASDSPTLSSTQLSDLRLLTQTRIVYALTHPAVAGAIAQTNVFDYRRDDGQGPAHFGVPVSSVEVRLRSDVDDDVAGNRPKGEMVVAGPAVARKAEDGKGEGVVGVGVKAWVRGDCTLALV